MIGVKAIFPTSGNLHNVLFMEELVTLLILVTRNMIFPLISRKGTSYINNTLIDSNDLQNGNASIEKLAMNHDSQHLTLTNEEHQMLLELFQKMNFQPPTVEADHVVNQMQACNDINHAPATCE